MFIDSTDIQVRFYGVSQDYTLKDIAENPSLLRKYIHGARITHQDSFIAFLFKDKDSYLVEGYAELIKNSLLQLAKETPVYVSCFYRVCITTQKGVEYLPDSYVDKEQAILKIDSLYSNENYCYKMFIS